MAVRAALSASAEIGGAFGAGAVPVRLSSAKISTRRAAKSQVQKSAVVLKIEKMYNRYLDRQG